MSWTDHLADNEQAMRQIKEYGFLLISTEMHLQDATLGVAFTVGMEPSHGLPEVFVIGLAPEQAAPILGQYATWLSSIKLPDGQLPPEAFQPTVDFSNYPTRGAMASFETMVEAGLQLLCVEVVAEMGREPRFIQMQLSDPTGRLPGEEGYMQNRPELAWAQCAFEQKVNRALH